MSIRTLGQEMIQEADTEKGLEIDRVREDKGTEVRVLEDTGREIPAPEMIMTVEEEEEEDKGREASAQEMIVVEEEEEDMREEGVMLAMGAIEKFAQRP